MSLGPAVGRNRSRRSRRADAVTTTPAVREKIRQSSASEYELAAQYGIGRPTVQRWNDRDSVEDRSHTPHRLQTALNAGQEELVVYLRRQLRMPVNDVLSVVRECIHPTMGRSSLHPRVPKSAVTMGRNTHAGCCEPSPLMRPRLPRLSRRSFLACSG